MAEKPHSDQTCEQQSLGHQMHIFIRELFGICRSLTGPGTRETLRRIQLLLPGMHLHEVPSGTEVFDWTVPDEWTIRSARLVGPAGETIVDFTNNNLHVLGYSIPVDKEISLEDLQEHLYSLPEQPDAIPYITSYYSPRWGFCLTHRQREALRPGTYRAVIDTDIAPGHLTYGELLIPGANEKEILLSTYVCHPSMANNELSGPAVTTFLGKWLLEQPKLRYSYRIVFIPETIGSITYLSKNLDHLKRHVIAGFNISCGGDNRAYSYLPSRRQDTISDTIAKHVLKWIEPNYITYNWGDRGSDERQYCAPGIDLPIASIMRTKYGEYPEYHTSLDDLVNVVTPEGLEGGYNALLRAIEALEKNVHPRVNVLCEPQLGKRVLYPTLSTKKSNSEVRLMMDFLTWADGENSLLQIAEKSGAPIWDFYPILDKMKENELVETFEC